MGISDELVADLGSVLGSEGERIKTRGWGAVYVPGRSHRMYYIPHPFIAVHHPPSDPLRAWFASYSSSLLIGGASARVAEAQALRMTRCRCIMPSNEARRSIRRRIPHGPISL